MEAKTTQYPAVSDGLLYTDHYQLTMAQLYYRMGMHETPACFEHFFRNYPAYNSHQAGYCVNAGLQTFLEWLETARLTEQDRACLAGLRSKNGEQLFGDDFIDWLGRHPPGEMLTVHAVPEGRVVHPGTPLIVVEGPLASAQVIETALLNQVNYQILVATKAARIADGAAEQPVLEFGLRRAQHKGGNAGTRAALIGGAGFSSNVGASYELGYPSKGTHAHSMIQAFTATGGGEIDAFRAYAEVYPDDCLLLVDTFDTLHSGIPNAIKVFEELRRRGHEPVGIRLDSGDLAYLAVQAARMLDDAGFPDTRIVLSNELDELVIRHILDQIRSESPRYGIDPDRLIERLMFGVGTRLITSQGAGALDGIYKLVALRSKSGWEPVTKVSETPAKTLTPGRKRVWRLWDQRGKATADFLSCTDEDPRNADELLLRHPRDPIAHRHLPVDELSGFEELLQCVVRNGHYAEPASIDEARKHRRADIDRLDPGVRRIVNPHSYHVSLSEKLWQLKQKLVTNWEENPDERGNAL